MGRITSVEHLRAKYPPTHDRAVKKELAALETHCRRFIALSPFLVLASQGKDGRGDNSPRGDKPGFVQVLSDTLIAIPDRPGNNRLDSLSNIIDNPAVGLLFMIPGINEILRINGRAELRDDPELMTRFIVDGKPPRLVVLVHVESVYLHCAKALMRSALWSADAQVERSVLPSLAEMIRDQTGGATPAETQAEMEQRYRATLY
jgi:hypothetical protein